MRGRQVYVGFGLGNLKERAVGSDDNIKIELK